ncbi:hypothetical protein GGH96_002130 [Coemansia sp. RSA 1972]|nr:hypothetical protein GGH96_002130 [Coemansia sp. RSA 1972]
MLTSSLMRGGKWSSASLAFLFIAVVQAALNIALEACLIHKLHGRFDFTLAHTTFDSGFICAQVGALMLAVMALHVRSEPLATAATALDILLVVFQAAQLAQTGVLHVEVLQAVGICALVLGSAAKAWLTCRRLKKEFGWQVCRALGADLGMQRMFFCQQLLLALVIVAAFLLLQLWLQLAAGAWINIVASLVASAIVLGMCLFAAVQELCWLMYSCVATFTAAGSFFVYKLVDISRRVQTGDDDAGLHYVTLLLAMLLVLDVALITIALVVVHAFGRGLRERLRRFQILARGEVDLDAIPRNDPCTAQTDTESTFSDIMVSTIRSLKDSPMMFRAFFSGLDMPEGADMDYIMSVCSLPSETSKGHTLETSKSQSTAPTLASLQLSSASLGPFDFSSMSPEQSIDDIPSASERSSHMPVPQGLVLSAPAASVEWKPIPRISALVLSIEELNTFNDDLVAGRPLTHEFLGAAATSPAASWSLVSSISFRDSTSTAGIKSPTHSIPTDEKACNVQAVNSVDECALHATIQRPQALHINSRRACRSEDSTSIVRTMVMQSMYSTATSSDDSSIDTGSRSRATMLNESF